MQGSLPEREKRSWGERVAEVAARPFRGDLGVFPALAGVVVLFVGVLELYVPDTTPLPWSWLQDTLSAVFPNPESVVRGTVLLVLGGMAYGWSVRRSIPVPAGLRDVRLSAFTQSGGWALDSWLLAATLYAATIGLILAGSTGYGAGLVFLAALMASVVAVARRYPRPGPLFSRVELVWLSLAVIAACILYLHDAYGWFFAWIGDEYAFFAYAQGIAQGGQVNIFQQAGVYGTHPVMDSVFQAATMRLFGVNAFGWRASCSLATALTAFPLYLLARMLYAGPVVGAPTRTVEERTVRGKVTRSWWGKWRMQYAAAEEAPGRAAPESAAEPKGETKPGERQELGAEQEPVPARIGRDRPWLVGALAVGMYMPAQVLLAYAHIGYNEPDALFSLVASLALLVAGRLQRAPLYLFLAGAFAGLGWYTISTSRVAIGLVLLGVVMYRPRWREAARDIGLILAGFALVLLPLVLVNGESVFTALVNQSRLTGPGLPPLGVQLSQNGVRSIYAFIYSTQVDNHYVSGALFDSVSAFFLLLGMAALLAWRTAGALFLFLSYWILVAVNGPTYYALHLNTTRMYIVVPVAAVVAAVGAATLIDQLQGVVPEGSLSPAVPVAVVVILTVMATNLYTFYYLAPARMQSTPQALEMRVIQAHPKATVIEAGHLTQSPFEIALQAYRVADRVLAQGPLGPELRQARRSGRPVIVLALEPSEVAGIGGRQVTVWDPAHLTHLTAVFFPG